jgi:hypothetical protein
MNGAGDKRKKLVVQEQQGRCVNRDDELFSREKITFLEQSARRVLVEASTDVTLQTPLGIKRVASQKAQDAQQSRTLKRSKSLVDEVRRRVETSRSSEAFQKASLVRRPSQYEDLMKAARTYQRVAQEILSLVGEEKSLRGKLITTQFEDRKALLKSSMRSLGSQRHPQCLAQY